jgi:hypothetical protein
MSEVVRFIPKSDLERIRLIQEARAIYERVFPPVDPVRKPRDDPKGMSARAACHVSGGK